MKKSVNKAEVYKYILSAIDNSCLAIDENKTFQSDADRIKYVFDSFNSCFNHKYERHRTPNLQARIADWFMGLPSAISIDFSNCDILILAKQWGSLPDNATEKQEEKIISNWFNFIAANLLQLATKNKVDYTYLY